MHDSSAAIIPYLKSCKDSFVLISTGTWCISLNPFNQIQLTDEDLKQDCLCYLSYDGKQIKASRLFAGYEHEQGVKTIASQFNKNENFYKGMRYDDSFFIKAKEKHLKNFAEQDLKSFDSCEEAYHALMIDIIQKQVVSTNLVLHNSPVEKIFVDGGFSTNEIYMQMLANNYGDTEIYAAVIPQATALGAAIILHKHWNANILSGDLIKLKQFVKSA